MIIRSLVRLWRWLHRKSFDRMSDDWIQSHAGTIYDDNPRAKARYHD